MGSAAQPLNKWNGLESFIDRIEVFNDERVKIHFTFKDVLAGYAE